ncbi:Hypothetical predicted protein [Olea europaea subsp. europaea]|uniref:Transmembrane protein n=1 Tax=Olea europaea subsp. europaea TaxID=158383 RepID=A0A8S0U3Y3_OLEEU|nr:Hypothetical predicted protein [Olea europaea subsp. europaea]
MVFEEAVVKVAVVICVVVITVVTGRNGRIYVQWCAVIRGGGAKIMLLNGSVVGCGNGGCVRCRCDGVGGMVALLMYSGWMRRDGLHSRVVLVVCFAGGSSAGFGDEVEVPILGCGGGEVAIVWCKQRLCGVVVVVICDQVLDQDRWWGCLMHVTNYLD